MVVARGLYQLLCRRDESKDALQASLALSLACRGGLTDPRAMQIKIHIHIEAIEVIHVHSDFNPCNLSL